MEKLTEHIKEAYFTGFKSEKYTFKPRTHPFLGTESNLRKGAF